MSSSDSGSDLSHENLFKVLVIDDDRVFLQIVCSMLEQCGYEATKCNSGAEGLKMLREKKGEFDIVLTDVHMPDMDGFQLLEEIGLHMDIPVIMLTVDSSPEMKMKGLTWGACDYLIKPVKMEELKNIGQHVLNWRKANGDIVPDSMDIDEDENGCVSDD